MGRLRAAFESLPWTSVEIPLGFQRVAAELEKTVSDEAFEALARGFHENNECLLVLTPQSLEACTVRAFRLERQTWPTSSLRFKADAEEERHVVELTAPGRRVTVRLVKDPASEALLKLLDERLNPKPTITFRPYAGRA